MPSPYLTNICCSLWLCSRCNGVEGFTADKIINHLLLFGVIRVSGAEAELGPGAQKVSICLLRLLFKQGWTPPYAVRN